MPWLEGESPRRHPNIHIPTLATIDGAILLNRGRSETFPVWCGSYITFRTYNLAAVVVVWRHGFCLSSRLLSLSYTRHSGARKEEDTSNEKPTFQVQPRPISVLSGIVRTPPLHGI